MARRLCASPAALFSPLTSIATARAVPAALVIALTALTTLAVQDASAQDVDEDLWITDGTVNTIVESDGTVYYVGGLFDHLGPATGGFAPLDVETAELRTSFPKVTGTVYAIEPDGGGGWYVGGDFTHVNGVPRSNLAHLNSDFALTAWDPEASNRVYAIAVSGPTVYVGGSFTTMGGVQRNALAAFDATTGQLTSWDPDASSWLTAAVYALAVSDSVVYAGGNFHAIGGVPREYIAGISTISGTATGWDPSASGDVRSLVVSGSSVYAGGSFDEIGGKPRGLVAELDAVTGAATTWNPNGSGPSSVVYSLVVTDSVIYAAGRFGSMGGQERNALAALEPSTGNATAWNAVIGGSEVRALALRGSLVYAAGNFTTIGGLPREFAAAIDNYTSFAMGWNPMLLWPQYYGGAHALAISGSTVCVGGNFKGANAQIRRNAAAFDAATGAATAWDPVIGGEVNDLAVSGNTVYACGQFTQVNWMPRQYIAAVDAATGLLREWDPNADDYVRALAVSGSTVFAAGEFRNIGGLARNYIAALDATTGAATAWDPQTVGSTPGTRIHSMLLSGSTLFVAGDISFRIGSATFIGLAALDAVAGGPADWSCPWPSPRTVRAIAISGPTLYMGGDFTAIGSEPRNHVAALDLASGTLTPWDPNAGDNVHSLAVGGSTVYVGGEFYQVGGQPRRSLAAVDATSGALRAWDAKIVTPYYGETVFTLYTSGPTVYAGGDYRTIGGLPNNCLAALEVYETDVPEVASEPVAALRLENAPNPFDCATTIRFVLPTAAQVQMDIYNVGGRRVATLLRDAWTAAGAHRLDFRPAKLPSGVYLCRLQAGTQVQTTKLLIVR